MSDLILPTGEDLFREVQFCSLKDVPSMRMVMEVCENVTSSYLVLYEVQI